MIAAKYPARDGPASSLRSGAATLALTSRMRRGFGAAVRGRPLGDHPDVLDSRRLNRRHGANHLTVRHLIVGADKNLAVGTLLRNRFQLVGQLVGRQLGVIQIDFTAARYRYDELFFLARQRLGLYLGQVYRDALLNDRRR